MCRLSLFIIEQEVECKQQNWAKPAVAYSWTQLWNPSQEVEVSKKCVF